MNNQAGSSAPSAPPAPAASGRQVTSGLNLWLPLQRPEDMPTLLAMLVAERPNLDKALIGLHYVHFARFLPAPNGAALQVITEFDGEFDAYVLDFVLAIGAQFDKILRFIRGAPPVSVMDDPARFLAFVRANNLGYSADQPGNIRLFSAYPGRTVLDIISSDGQARRLPPVASVADAKAVPVDRSDVQANVLRGVKPTHACHLGLRFGPNPLAAHRLLDELLAGSHGAPQISNDADRVNRKARPDYWLCVGFTYRGLLALGIGDGDRAEFEFAHKAFVRGPDEREAARANGDVGDSQPAMWTLGGSVPVDMVASIYTNAEAMLAKQRELLKARCKHHGVAIVDERQAAALVDKDEPGQHRVHFGYVDGITQPRLAIVADAQGAPADQATTDSPEPADLQPLASVGEFLLGSDYPNVFGGKGSIGRLSSALAQNATFAALRVMEQDVRAFEKLLDDAARQVPREITQDMAMKRRWIAAKLMGRWQNGASVTLHPFKEPDQKAPPHDNRFDYLPSDQHPEVQDDSAGSLCPMGAHARRMNPRSARVAGRPHSRRLLRRGVPYSPEHTKDGTCGLIGVFLCADLDRQFEFLLRQWAQGDRATTGLVGQQDPFIGAQQTLPGGSIISGKFRIPGDGNWKDIEFDVPRLVKTIGSVYLFMPGLAGLRHLADLRPHQAPSPRPEPEPEPEPEPASSGPYTVSSNSPKSPSPSPAPDPMTFDPRAKDHRDDPFAAYAAFRAKCPVAAIPSMNSVWVFSDRHITEVTSAPGQFRKRHSGETSPTGLLNMDAPFHAGSRTAYGQEFDDVLRVARLGFEKIVADTYQAHCRGKSSGADAPPIDWVAGFAKPVAQAVFLDVFGLGVEDTRGLIAQVEDLLALATPADDKVVQAEIVKRQAALVSTLFGLQPLRTKDRLFDRFLKVFRPQPDEPFDPVNNKPRPPLSAVALEQMVNSATLAMTGILPLQWFIALACWRLLENDGQLLKEIKSDKDITERMVVDELLRFDMSPPMSSRHVAQDNTALGGLVLNRDQRVNLVFASANRDKRRFGEDAGKIKFRRDPPGPGWAFGKPDDKKSDKRECLGKDLVYAVMEQVILQLRNADPVPRLAAGFKPHWGTWTEGAVFRAMINLLVHS